MSKSYYQPEDLKKFGEVGTFKKELMDKFFSYYGEATGSDGALDKKTKSLIALAVSHALKCPYCIDSYTETCLQAGSNPDEMTEAIPVAAAMQAGITLVHGVQMQNVLKNNGAM